MKRNGLSTSCLKDYITHNNNTKELSSPSSSYTNNKNQMMKDLWNCKNNSHNNNGEDYMNGFPWPPRSYTCSFCRKEFKSAQALGGHMNVHRRDRARLRQSPPISSDHHGQAPMLNLNLNPTTTPTTTTNNPIFSTSSLSLLPSSSSSSTSCASHKPITSTLPLFVSTSTPPSPSPSELKRWVLMDGVLVSPLSKKTSSSEATKAKVNADQSLSGFGGYDAFAREDHHECKILKKKDEILRVELEIGLPRDHYDLDLELRLGTYS